MQFFYDLSSLGNFCSSSIDIIVSLRILRPCLHGVGDPGLVG